MSAETTMIPSAANESGVTGQINQRPCFQILEMMAQVVTTLAEERATDGMVSLEELRRIMEMARDAGSPLIRAFEIQENRCRKQFRPSVRHATSRNDVFHRLMVRPFETLLEGDPPSFPRAYLPNYFEVVEAAFGDKLTQYQQKTREIFQDMLVRRGNDLAWDVFFNDSRVHIVLTRALSRLMVYVESPAGQWAWLTCMGRHNADGGKPTSDQAEMVLGALRTTWKAMPAPEAR